MFPDDSLVGMPNSGCSTVTCWYSTVRHIVTRYLYAYQYHIVVGHGIYMVLVLQYSA